MRTRKNLERVLRKIEIVTLVIMLFLGYGLNASKEEFKVKALSPLDTNNTIISSEGIISWYNGDETDILIPDEIDEIKVRGIADKVFMNKGLTSVEFTTTALKTIGKQAFQNNKLVNLDLPNTVTSIGEQAFFQNKLKNLKLSSGLLVLGRFAFRDNNLTSVTLPSSLDKLAEGVFMQNPNLATVNLEHLIEIGDSAFAECNFDTVTLPSALQSYGTNVFVKNKRYVLVSGSSLATTYSITNQFGEIAGSIRTLTLKIQDESGNELLDDITYTTNRNIQATSVSDLVVDGNKVVVHFPKIEEYLLLDDSSKEITINGDTVYIVKYKKVGSNPLILGLVDLVVDIGDPVDLKAGITAIDKDGNDLTSQISITPSTINTSAAWGYVVKYTVRDSAGRTTTEYRNVTVGNDPMKMEVGLGWLYEDFLYSTNGSQLEGLSASGKAKFDAGKTAIVLPGKCPLAANGNEDVEITTIKGGNSVTATFPYAFKYISFAQLTGLVTIGGYSFSNSTIGAELEELDLRMCTKLVTIGMYAFYSSKLNTLDLVGCTSIKEIQERAFFSSQLTKLNLKDCRKLEIIGTMAFYNSKLTELDLGNCVALKEIRSYAFYSSPLTELVINNCLDLTLIDNSAFMGALLKELDLSGLTKLRTIGMQSFYGSPLKRLKLGNCNSLQIIGYGAFQDALLTTLDLSDCVSLVTIEGSAFYRSPLITLNLSNCTKLKTIDSLAFCYARLATLDLSKNVALELIGTSTFSSSRLTSLNLSGNTKLKKIGDNAFSEAILSELDLSNCLALETIGANSFLRSPLTELDLRNLVNLNTIGMGAFAKLPNNSAVYLPDTVTTLNWPFGVRNEGAIWVYTNTGLTSLTDKTDKLEVSGNQPFLSASGRENHILINKVGYYLDLKDSAGNDLLVDCQLVAIPMTTIGNPQADINRTVNVVAPDILGYITPPAQTLILDGSNSQKVSFTYTKMASLFDPAISVNISSLSFPNNFVQIPNELVINVSFSSTASLANIPAGSEIIVPFYDTMIDLTSLRIQPGLSNDGIITGWYIASQQLHLVLREIVGGEKLNSFPIVFKYRNIQELNFYHQSQFDAFVIDGNSGNMLVSSDLANPAITYSRHNKMYLNSNVDIYRDAQSPDVLNRPLDVYNDTDVPFGWNVIRTASRSYQNYVIMYDVPKYLDSNGNIRSAQFIPEDNPLWEVATDKNGNPMVDTAGNPLRVVIPSNKEAGASSTPDTYSYISYRGYLQVKFRFPNAKAKQIVETRLYLIAIPDTPNAWETQQLNDSYNNYYLGKIPLSTYNVTNIVDLYYASTVASFYINDTKPLPDGEIILTTKSANPQSGNDGHGEFFDNDSDRIFEWKAALLVGPKYKASNAILKDYDLDPRMYYYGVNVGKAVGKVEIVAYDDKDIELSREIPISANYSFGKSIQQDIATVEIRILEEFSGIREFIVQTRLRNPGMTQALALTTGGIDFYNHLQGSFNYEEKTNASSGFVSHSESNYWRILHVDESLAITKIATPDNWVFNGDYLEYKVQVSGYKMPKSTWQDFALLDILPDCVDIVDVEMTSAFTAFPDAKYKIIDDYQGSGKTAILFTAKTVNFTGATMISSYFSFLVANIYVRVKPLYGASKFTNNVYTKVSNSSVEFISSVPANQSYYLNGNNPSAKHGKENNYLMVEEFSMRKYIRNIVGDDTSWNSQGISTKPNEEFEYKLSLENLSLQAYPDGIVYDIFPFVGDTLISKTSLGSSENIPRNSEFNNIFKAVVSIPNGWTVYYCDDPLAENSRQYYSTYNWKTAGQISDMSKVRGLKIVANSAVVIGPMTKLDFIFRMEAPNNPSLEGKKAYNTAAHIENWVGKPSVVELECQGVYNEIRQRGDISLRKTDETDNPLAGGIFQLLDSTGKVIQTKESDSNGIVVFDYLLLGNYSIKEILAPSGYKASISTIKVLSTQMIPGGTYFVGDVKNELIPPPPKTGDVKLKKNSILGHNLANVQFIVKGLDVGVNDNINITKSTNTKGEVVFWDLPLGNYKIEELQTSALGKLVGNWSSSFSLTNEGVTVDLGVVLNEKAKLDLVKIGIYNEDFQNLPNEELTTQMGAKLNNIEFELWENNTNVTALHSDSGVTDVGGHLAFYDLDLEKTYILKEKLKSGQSYLYEMRGSGLANNEYELRIDLDGKLYLDSVLYENETLVIGNNAKISEFQLQLRKVDQNGNPLENVEFKIESENASVPKYFLTDEYGEVLLTKSQLENLFPGANGKFLVTEVKAPLGYAKETGLYSIQQFNWNDPAGYAELIFVNYEIELEMHKYDKLTSNVYETIQYLELTHLLNKYNETSTLSDMNINDSLDIVNAAQVANLKLSVNKNQIELRKPLAGASFKVTQISGTNSGTSFIGLSNSDGKLEFSPKLLIDENESYEIKEIASPIGYLLDDTPMIFKVVNLKLTGGSGRFKYQAGVITLDVDNDPMKGNITITKLDERQGTVLTGVGFTLLDSLGNIIGTDYTDSHGVALFPDLPIGSYTVIESTPLTGYEANLQEYHFVISPSQDIYNHYLTVYNKTIEKFSKLLITKVDEEDLPLAKMEFGLEYRVDDSEPWGPYLNTLTPPYYFTNNQGKLVFEHLPAGDYKIIEFTDEKVYGEPIYLLDNQEIDGSFTVSSEVEENIEIKVINPKAQPLILSIPGEKTVVGLDISADIEFTFSLIQVEDILGTPWSTEEAISTTAIVKTVETSEEEKTYDFSLDIDVSDLEYGIYYFIVEESSGAVNGKGWHNDHRSYLVEVEVRRRVVEVVGVYIKDNLGSYEAWSENISFVNTYLFQPEFSFYKVDEKDEVMADVKFALYHCNEEHQHSWLVEDQSGNCWSQPSYELSDNDGLVKFSELSPGEYMLVEVETNPGYQLPHGQWLITIDDNYDISITAHGSNSTSLPPAFKQGGGALTDSLILPNYRAMVMPFAGGAGVLIFTVVGIVLQTSVVIYLIWLIISKKRQRIK